MQARNFSITLAALAVALYPAVASADTPTARAVLRSGNELALGAPAQLAVTVEGGDAEAPTPRVAGASVQLSGQMQQTTINNGAESAETTFIYTIVPRRLGALDIPAITVTTAGGLATTAPVHATVTDAPVAPSASASGAAPASDLAEPRAASNEPHAFVTMELPSKQLYVGQAVPVKIRAYFRGGTSATLQGPPHVTSDAFTLGDLTDKPAQAQVEIRGVPYLQATWTAVLSPAKPITGALGVELPVELAYRADIQQRPHPRRTLQDIFGADPFGGMDPFGGADPFAGTDPFGGDTDSMFDVGPMQRQQTTLRATVDKLVVADLPTIGKPAGFTGAVGQFALAVEPIADEPRVGEPIAVTTRVTGTGNFDRVALAGIAETPQLKVYGVTAAFAASGASKLTGVKTFTQTVVSTHAGALALPAITFDYFDPIKRAYVTATATPPSLQVAAARDGGSADPGLATSAAATTPAMTVNAADGGRAHTTLEPAFRQRGFKLATGGLALVTALLLGAAYGRRSARMARVLSARRIGRTVARASLQMDRAARAHDRAAFFTAARAALQARLAAAWHIAPDAVTAIDVDVRLGAAGAEIRSVLEHADRVEYAPDLSTTEPLDHWRTVVRGALARLESMEASS